MIRFLSLCALAPTAVFAEVPQVMTDFAPVHSLTAQVMGDLGVPDVLLPAGTDPHDYAMRPSDAANLGAADLVFWTGPSLTPWLSDLLDTLAPNAAQVALLDVTGWDTLPIRDIQQFVLRAAEDDHGHDDHEDHEDEHDDHGHDDHADFDPHAWLDPAVAQVWLAAIADQLSTADPDNAATYTANADAAIARLTTLDAELAAQLAPFAGLAYILPHDGYQYFEARYGLTAAGAIAGIDARTPGPAQVASLRDQMADSNIVCVFSDAEIGDRWATVVTEGTGARTAQIDGVGAGLDSGPALYEALLRRLADDFAACLGGA
ncbi:MAG: zinc ABC transporter substrate-binding protein [Proteobacteria bacterium]|nr:zinc ABC transporter substrate-binding protein [Pseudomonadota bacterium]